jgi:maltose alpha-D-glucosyltransferase/alpha-amylase
MALSLVKGDLDGRATAAFWQEVRQMLDQEYPEHVMIAEGGNPAVAVGLGGFHIDFCLPWRMPAYNSLFRKSVTNEGGSQSGVDRYGFNVFDNLGHGNIQEFMDEFQRHFQVIRDLGFICIPEGNHDLHPRLSQGRSRDEILQALLFTFCMPGVPFLYYGDEIGMRTVWGLHSKEGSYDRTGIRTPMQWDASPNAGFSTAPAEKLYLPLDPADDRPTVQAQESDPASLLNQVRRLIELRRTHPALQANAEFQVLYAERGRMPIVLGRRKVGERLVIAINPTAQAVSTTLEISAEMGGASSEAETLFGQPGALVKQGAAWTISLPPASGGIYRV